MMFTWAMGSAKDPALIGRQGSCKLVSSAGFRRVVDRRGFPWEDGVSRRFWMIGVMDWRQLRG